MKQPYKTALYMRLSKDDEQFGDSVSIETQRNILNQFVMEQGFPVVDEYVDDGWTGTNFERPNFERMIDDINDGKVNCVIVKDLSRFGREHVQMDFYLEYIFPEKGVRFIAVTDNEDSERGLSDFVPIKNLFNEWFAKDTSRKIKAAFRAKYLAGDHVFTHAPLGYKKDPDNKCHLLIDDETKWIVEKIYKLALTGAGASKIQHILVNEKVPTPAWLNFQRYGTWAHVFEGKPENKKYDWGLCQIKKILSDQVYLGHSVHYKDMKVSFKSKKRVHTAKDKWLIVENTHEPIVSEETFKRVQELVDKRRRPRKDGTNQIFAGLLRCADCGCMLVFNVNRQNKNPYAYYRCRKYSERVNQCTSHYIRYDVLYNYVRQSLQTWSNLIQRDEEAVAARLMKSDSESHLTNKRSVDVELRTAQQRLNKLDNMLSKLYEDRIAGAVNERNFSMLTQKYQEEQEALESKIAELSTEIDSKNRRIDDIRNWIRLVKEARSFDELTTDILNALIDKIVVHETVRHEDGTKSQDIDIYYRNIGRIE